MQEAGERAEPTEMTRLVLIVEDDDVTRTMIERVYEAAGFTVASCTTVRDALRALETMTPALIHLDVRLPDLNGVALLGAMRARSDTADTPIVIGTGFTESLPAELPYDRVTVVAKPFAADELLASALALIHA